MHSGRVSVEMSAAQDEDERRRRSLEAGRELASLYFFVPYSAPFSSVTFAFVRIVPCVLFLFFFFVFRH